MGGSGRSTGGKLPELCSWRHLPVMSEDVQRTEHQAEARAAQSSWGLGACACSPDFRPVGNPSRSEPQPPHHETGGRAHEDPARKNLQCSAQCRARST